MKELKDNLYFYVIIGGLVANAALVWESRSKFENHLMQPGHPVMIERVDHLERECR